MCVPKEKDLKLKLNEKGEGWAYKFFLGNEEDLRALCDDGFYFEPGRWIKSTFGPGFFMYRFKKDGITAKWIYRSVKRIKFRGVSHQGIDSGKQIIVAKEIFIPK